MRMILWAAAALLFLAKVSPVPAQNAPQKSQDNHTAASTAAEMKAGQEADAKQDYASAMAAYRKAIEMDAQNADAHKHFIESALNQATVGIRKLFDNPDYEKLLHGQLHGKAQKAVEAQRKKANAEEKADNDALLATYDHWIAIHPNMAVFYWAKGYTLTEMEKPTGEEELFQEAITLDPKFVPAYTSMAQIEFNKGNYSKQRQYLRQAMELDPAKPEVVCAFAETFQFSDSETFRQLAEKYAMRFPKASDCTYLLWQLENAEPTATDRISLLERMRHSYVDTPISTAGMDEPDVFTNWLEESMADLFNLYAQNAPQKALYLAQEMQKQKWADRGWKNAVAYQRNLINALGLISAAKYSDASALLQREFSGVIVKYYIDRTPATLAIAQAQAADGNVRQAFETLAAAWIKTPNLVLESALLKYGLRPGRKTPTQVNDAVWQKWTSSAKQMKPFELKTIDNRKKVKLFDFHGRVILVSFWFPLCAPCRGELPYLDEVAKKYKSKGFAILAINGIPAQNSYAPGVLKNYDILGLKAPSSKWAEQYDHVSGYPTNYLVDGRGRIMAHPRVADVNSMKALEMQIDALLAHSLKVKDPNFVKSVAVEE